MIRDKSALRALHTEIINDLDIMNQAIVKYVAAGTKADVEQLQTLFHTVYCGMHFSSIHSAKILSAELEEYLTIFGSKVEYDLEDTQTVLNTISELKTLLESPDASIDVDSWLNLINAMRLRSGKHLSSVAAIDSTIAKLKTQADNTDMKQALVKTRAFFRHALLSLHKKDFPEGFRFLHGATRYLKVAAPDNSLLGSFSDEVGQLVDQIEASGEAAGDSKNIRLIGKLERVLSNRSNENKWKQTLFELQSWLKEHNKDDNTMIKGLLGKSYRRDLTNFLEVLNEAIAEKEFQKVKGIIRDSEQLLALVNIQVNFVGHFGLDQLKRLREQVKQTLNPANNEDSFEVALTSGRKTVCEQSLRTVNGWKLELLSEQPDYPLISKQLFEMSKSLQLAALPTLAEVALVFSARIVKQPPLSLTQLAEVVSDIEYALDQEVENELPTGLAHTFDVSFEILQNRPSPKAAQAAATQAPELFESVELDEAFFDNGTDGADNILDALIVDDLPEQAGKQDDAEDFSQDFLAGDGIDDLELPEIDVDSISQEVANAERGEQSADAQASQRSEMSELSELLDGLDDVVLDDEDGADFANVELSLDDAIDVSDSLVSESLDGVDFDSIDSGEFEAENFDLSSFDIEVSDTPDDDLGDLDVEAPEPQTSDSALESDAREIADMDMLDVALDGDTVDFSDVLGADDLDIIDDVDVMSDAPVSSDAELPTSAAGEAKDLAATDAKEQTDEEFDAQFDAEILEIFLEEANEILENLSDKIDGWQGNRNEEVQSDVRKDFHTLKGSSRMAGCVKIGELAWSTETLLNKLIEGSITYNRSIADAVRQSSGTIAQLVKELETKGAELSNIHGLKETIDAMAEGLGDDEDGVELLDIAEVAIDDDDGLQLVEKADEGLPQAVLDAEKAMAEQWLDEDDGEEEQDHQMIIGDTLGQLALLKDKVQSYQTSDKALLDNVLEQVTYNLAQIDLGGVSNDLNMAHQQFFADPENNINWINSNIDRVIQLIEKDEAAEEIQDDLLQTQLDAVVELSFGEVTVANVMSAKGEIAPLLSIDEKYLAIQKVAAAFNKAIDLDDNALIIDGANILLNQMDALAAGMSIVADEDFIEQVEAKIADKEILEVPWDERFEPEGVEELELDQEFKFDEQDFTDIVDGDKVSELDAGLAQEIEHGSQPIITPKIAPEATAEQSQSADVSELQGDMESVLDLLNENDFGDVLDDADASASDGHMPETNAVAAPESVNLSPSEPEPVQEPETNAVEEVSEEILVIREIFQQETEELMDTYAEGLSQWSDDTQHEILDVIKRVLHTLKGGARLSQLFTVADEAHALEEEILYYDKDKSGDLLILLENRYFTLKEKLHIAFTVGEQAASTVSPTAETSQTSDAVSDADIDQSDLSADDNIDSELMADADTHDGVDDVLVEHFDESGLTPSQSLDDAASTAPESTATIDLDSAFDDALNSSLDEALADSVSDQETAALTPEALASLDDSDVLDVELADEELSDKTLADVSSDAAKSNAAQSAKTHVDTATQSSTQSTTQKPQPEKAAAAQEKTVENKFQLSETVRLPVELLENLSGLVAENSASRARLESGLRTIDDIFGEINTTLSTINDHVRSLEIEAQSQKSYNVSKTEQGDNFDSLEMDQYSRIYELSQRLSEMTSDLMDYRSSIADKIRDMDVALVQQQRSGREISSELQQTQLVSLNTLVPRVRLMARDISAELEKSVNVSFSGMDSKVNRHAIQKLLPALEHILRNALDHGIEKAAERAQYGKAETGQIAITAKEYQSYLELIIEDDGSGIDVDAVRKKAIAKGFMTENEAVSRQQILQFIFRSGFSTAENVTQLSGRGVGMEIVANELRSIGGSIDINTEKYKGTQFVLRIPVNISANTSLLLNAGDNHYAIPLVNIRAITRAELSHQLSAFEYGGEQYNLYFFEDVFKVESDYAESVRTIVILNSLQNIALAVPDVIGVREITVRPISPLVQQNTGLSGASIDSDGSILMVVDPVSIIEKQRQAEIEVDSEADADFTNTVPELTRVSQATCFIVDDSITVRKVTARLLERNDYKCESAKDGLDALEQIDVVQPDIILLDVEMPRMDGFEFLKVIRQSDTHRNIPVIMITSRTGDKHRRMALDLGADAYLGKPYQEHELLAEIERHLGANEIEL